MDTSTPGELRCKYCGYVYDYRPWMTDDKLHPYFCMRCAWFITAGYDPYPGRGSIVYADTDESIIYHFGRLVSRLYPRGLPIVPHTFQYGNRSELIRHYPNDESDMLEIATDMLHFPMVDQMIRRFGSWDNIMQHIDITDYPSFVPALSERRELEASFDEWQRAFLRQIQTVFQNTDLLLAPAQLEDSIVRYVNREIPRLAWSIAQADAIYEAFQESARLIINRHGSDANVRQVITKEFGDWYKVMYAVGIPIIKRIRGTLLHATDGHLCLSVMEKTIDDLLSQNGIEHEKEVLYPSHPTLNPRRRMRADWRLKDGTYVEYFGLAGDKDYDEKTQRKMDLCDQLQLNLVPVYTHKDIQALVASQVAKRRTGTSRD